MRGTYFFVLGVGQKYAVLEMKSIATQIVRNFELSITEEHSELVMMSDVVLRTENGIVLSVKKRDYS